MTERRSVEERLLEVSLPEPGSDLRDRVLAAAIPLVRPSATWADAVWFSRRWRLAAVALVLALGLLDHLSTVPASPARDDPGPAAVQAAQAAEETALQVGMLPEQAAALARRALIAATRPAPRSDLSIDELIKEHQ